LDPKLSHALFSKYSARILFLSLLIKVECRKPSADITTNRFATALPVGINVCRPVITGDIRKMSKIEQKNNKWTKTVAIIYDLNSILKIKKEL
jgi:hypothetical protein